MGVKPTIEKNTDPLAETHILDYCGNLYGRIIEVRFLRFVRDEKKFSSIEELKNQVHEDIALIRQEKRIQYAKVFKKGMNLKCHKE